MELLKGNDRKISLKKVFVNREIFRNKHQENREGFEERVNGRCYTLKRGKLLV